jgi:molybdopterin synthase catalytic subunit
MSDIKNKKICAIRADNAYAQKDRGLKHGAILLFRGAYRDVDKNKSFPSNRSGGDNERKENK